MAISAADVVAPVLSAPEVVALFLAGMAGQAGLGRFFRRFVLERDDLGGIAFGDVVLTGTMTRFTAGDLVLPTTNRGKTGMRRVRIGFKLIFVTVFARIAADVTRVSGLREHRRLRLSYDRLRLSQRRTDYLRAP